LVKERVEVGVGTLTQDDAVGIEYSFEPAERVAALVPKLTELAQVAADLPLMPGHQNRFDDQVIAPVVAVALLAVDAAVATAGGRRSITRHEVD
jgi:hypothetical protein